MDQKTFEYLKERVDAATKIQKQIKHLERNISQIKDVNNIFFYNNTCRSVFDSGFCHLTEKMKRAYVEVAYKEIKQLEEEFAKL